MKKMIALGLVLLSVNTFAASFVGTTLLPTQMLAATSLSSSGNLEKEANQVINDVQEYQASGKISAFLATKISSIQRADQSVSESDAIDALVAVSLEALK